MITWLYDHLCWIIGGTVIIVIAFLVILLRRGEHLRFHHYRKLARRSYNIACISLDSDIDKDHIEKPEWYEILQEELNRLPIGKIVFNPPEVMKLGIKDRIEARITKDLQENILASLKGRGIPQSEQLKISELMKVRLSGDDFNIIALNEEEQIIARTGFTEWAWDVTPKKSGKKILHLHVTLRIRLPFGEERKDHPVLDREIVVEVNPAYSVKIFLVSYWKWIVTALILPFIGLSWKLYTK